MKVIRRFSEFINESAIEVTPRSADSFVTILDKYDGEKEVGNNGGAMVEGFLKTIGLSKGQPWCQAFVYAVFDEFTKSKGISNPLPKTGSVLSHWKQAPESNKIKRLLLHNSHIHRLRHIRPQPDLRYINRTRSL